MDNPTTLADNFLEWLDSLDDDALLNPNNHSFSYGNLKPVYRRVWTRKFNKLVAACGNEQKALNLLAQESQP